MRSAKGGVGSARTAQCLAGARKRSVDRAAISKMPHQPPAASRPHAFFRAKRFHKRSEVEITPSELKEVRGPKAAAMQDGPKPPREPRTQSSPRLNGFYTYICLRKLRV